MLLIDHDHARVRTKIIRLPGRIMLSIARGFHICAASQSNSPSGQTSSSGNSLGWITSFVASSRFSLDMTG
ncbi:hypothetical protein [Desulfofundulus australicus]|uniref:hypothetical protein n=1 Tax=Desulfofundulus australicus TaxID=1566 RepID=UPI00093367E1|nr:hypothetical protein [Desulfofundulus australicus]